VKIRSFDILDRLRQRRQLGADRARRRFDRADGDRQRPPRHRRPQRHEITARQIAEHLCLAAFHAKQIGSTRHVDVEEGAPHQEVGGFRRDVLGELGQPLRGDDAGKATLAAPAHQVGHGTERNLAGFVGNLPGHRRRKQLSLVHHHQHGIPVIALRIEHAVQEGGGTTHLLFDVETFEIKHDGGAVLANAAGNAGEFGLRALRIDHDVSETVGERDEIALWVDHHLLHPGCALFEKTAQEMRLAGAGIALHQQTCRQQLLKIERGGCAALHRSHVDADLHAVLVFSNDRFARPPPGNRGALARNPHP
jgi:hypothetical protein